MSGPEALAFTFGVVSVSSAAVWLLRPIVVGLGRRLEGRAAPDPALASEVDELRQRLGTLEGVEQRLLEVEERLEFTERLLAHQQEPARLEEGHR